MSVKTNIEWCSSTGSPWIGCTKVSPGCKNCYASALDHQRFSRTMGGGTKENPVSHWGKGAPRFRTKGFWKDAVKWNKDAKYHFALRCDGCDGMFRNGDSSTCPTCGGIGRLDRPRIFPSLCDWLDEEVPIEWLADFLKLIHDTPNLDWLLLTKRPELWHERVSKVYEANRDEEFVWMLRGWLASDTPPANVWIGTSVEDQQRANERIPELLKIPAKVRFLSVEPLLGAIDLKFMARSFGFPQHITAEGHAVNMPQGIHWVIVGGESGPGSRECRVEWIRSIVQQCKAAGVPCFTKQVGSFCVSHSPDSDGWPAGTRGEDVFEKGRPDYSLVKLKHPKGGDPEEWPSDLRVREFPAQ